MAAKPSFSIGRLRAAFGLIAALTSLPAGAIDMGDASVLSMRGQRLRVAVPYGSTPGQKVPVMAISVGSVEVPDGYKAPDANAFVISQPENRNIIYLHSRESVTAPNLKLVLNVANSDTAQVAYEIKVPPLRYAQTALAEPGPQSKKMRRGSGKRKSAMAAVAKAPKASPEVKANSLFKPVVSKGCDCAN